MLFRSPPSVFRRNVITHGADLNELIDREFEVQGVRFYGTAECTPCYWMDRAFAPGAEAALLGHGGLRARIQIGFHGARSFDTSLEFFNSAFSRACFASFFSNEHRHATPCDCHHLPWEKPGGGRTIRPVISSAHASN